jgi:tRNA pseudouridine32 synthase/23S rRNA pseudouridine746 synthase
MRFRTREDLVSGRDAFSSTFTVEETATAADLLARLTGLPKARVKDCMTKGGVWLSRPGRKTSRLRRATTAVGPGERLEIDYDPELLAITPAQPELIAKTRHYSVWYKPAGILSQGTRFADHCTLPRLAQALLGARSEPHPVHRLDREARGIMVLAHDGRAAAKLGELFRLGKVDKEYEAIVRGVPDWTDMEVDVALDDKECRSHFHVVRRDPSSGTSLLTARIDTGRKHQIRRHLAGLGHPVMGDPRYGGGTARMRELQLVARSLAFTCPFTNKPMQWSVPGPTFPLPG